MQECLEGEECELLAEQCPEGDEECLLGLEE